jgi:LTXXQ motif family protein
MKTPFLFALAFAASVSVAAFTTPSFAQAQQQQAQGQPDDEAEASPSDKAAFLNARIAALKAVLALTAEQEKLWGPFETAIRDTAKESSERAAKLRNNPEPTNAFELLNFVADQEIARGQALKKFVQSAQPLVASFTPEQKRRVPAFLGLGDDTDRGPSSSEIWIFEDEAH